MLQHWASELRNGESSKALYKFGISGMFLRSVEVYELARLRFASASEKAIMPRRWTFETAESSPRIGHDV
jgi:hypothetical protein